MAYTQLHHEGSPLDRHVDAEIAALALPAQQLTADDQAELIASLAVCRSHLERLAILLTRRCGCTIAATARRMQSTPRRVQELLAGVALRLQLGREHHARADNLTRLARGVRC